VGEGKSTTACNLALALADSGSRVLLIDLNLRRPDVDGYLDLEPGAGAANVLAGRITFSRAVLRWVEGRMDVLPAGPVPLNPSEMLASRATAMLLDEVRGKYDFVIIDTPALLPVTDAAAVAARSDGAILVVRYGRTSEEQIADAVNALEAVGTSLLGVALTRTPGARRRRPQQVSAGSYPEPDPVPPSLPRPPARNVGPVGPEQAPHLPPRPATGEQKPVAPRPPQGAEQSGPMRKSSPDGGPPRTPADGHAGATAAVEHLPNGSTEKPAPSPSPRP
jgi:capsular exopolysaccharide synthesis family protein